MWPFSTLFRESCKIGLYFVELVRILRTLLHFEINVNFFLEHVRYHSKIHKPISFH